LKFVLVEWFLANLQSLGFEIWPNILLSPLYFTMIWDIDFVWGMRVYNKKSQINFEIHSGWMICSQLTAVGLWNLVTYLVVTTFFAMLEDIDLIFGLWVHSYELQIKAYISFRCNAIWPSYGPWTLQLGQIFSGYHFISLCFEILTWILVWECIIISYRWNFKFVPVEWFLAN
jgi:hypothetical protein